MQETDGLHAFKKVIQDSREALMVIDLMIHSHIFHMGGESLPLNKIQYPDEIALFIVDRISMHEVFVTGDQLEDAGLLSRLRKRSN